MLLNAHDLIIIMLHGLDSEQCGLELGDGGELRQIGGNDQLQRLEPAHLADNLRAMIREARDRNIAVVLIAVPAPGLSLRPLPLYAGIADEFGLAADLETVADILGDRALKSDYIHPNAAGYRRLALAVADLLRAAGAVP